MRVGGCVDQLHIYANFVPALCTAPSRIVETPSSCATAFRLSGLLWYFAVEVREMTLRSRTAANFVRISS